MKEKLLRNIVIFTFCLTVIFSCDLFGITVSAESNYTITGYDIDMVVNENNTFDITENITVDFNESSHGIYRKIPLKNSITRTDGSTSSNRAKISNVFVSEEFSVSKEDGYQIIKIGSSDITIKGAHSYTISYTYDIGKDPLKDADELYFNLIGDGWDTVIDGITFRITMPKEFDESLLGFSSGWRGVAGSDSVVYAVDGNEISGYLENNLYPGSALTVRLTLPEGYFVGASNNFDEDAVKVMSLCVICVLVSAIIWFIFGRDRHHIAYGLEFYPPNGWNSAEVGFCYYGNARTEGIISLMLYLANKGYLKIQRPDSIGLRSSRKRIIITKLREYYGNNDCERLFLKGLFKSGRMVTLSSLRNDFYTTFNQIKSKLHSREVKSLMYYSSSINKIPFFVVMILAIYVSITAVPLLDYGDIEFAVLPSGFTSIALVYIIYPLLKRDKILPVIMIFWSIFGGVPWAVFVLPYLSKDSSYVAMYILGVVCIAIIAMFARNMPRRTAFGSEMYSKIKGFRRFLQTATQSQLEILVSQDPNYLSYIIPYAYALGLSNKWMNQFKVLAYRTPDWYESNDFDDFDDFDDFMEDTMNSLQSVMTSSPSSSSDGGSSGGCSDGGGGSSGGGSGGGGGGSW